MDARAITTEITGAEEPNTADALKVQEKQAPATTPIVSELFRWEFLDNSRSGVCGMNKCFFRAKTDRNVDVTTKTKTGYLIAHYDKCDLNLGWDIAQRLEKTYGIHHLYLSPPRAVSASSEALEFAKKIRNKAEATFFYKVRAKEFSDRASKTLPSDTNMTVTGNKDDDKAHSYFQIQKVKVAPTPSLEWGDNWKRQKKCAKDFESFATSITDREAFSNRLLEQIASLAILLREEPWLLSDFQVLIDQFGTIIHIDLDRKPKSTKELDNQDDRRKFVLTSLKIILLKVVAGSRLIPSDQLSNLPKNFPKRLLKKVC
jgi:hypothetical protein